MKELIKLCLKLSVSSCLIIHLLFSYGCWDLNPGNWRAEIRAIAAFLFLITSIVIIAWASTNDSINKQQNEKDREN